MMKNKIGFFLVCLLPSLWPVFSLSVVEAASTGVVHAGERNSLVKSLQGKLGAKKQAGASFLNALAVGNEEGDRKALFEWLTSFQGNAFAKTSTGRALWAYLLFQNKLEVYGAEALFRVNRPKVVNGELKKRWRAMLPAQHWVWPLVQVKWSSPWARFFNQDIEARIKSRPSQKMGQRKILSLLKKVKPDSVIAAQLQFQLALQLAILGRTTRANKILDHLLNVPSGHIDKNLVALTAGRLAYPQGRWKQAIDYYGGVSKSSEYWFVAQEELAWVYMSKGEPQNAMAITSALMPEVFAAHVGPESIFLNAFSQLKICDYFSVAKSITTFKERFKKRVQALQQLQKAGPDHKGVLALWQELRLRRKGGPELFALGPAALQVPRYITRDQAWLSVAQAYVALEREEAQLGSFLAAAKTSTKTTTATIEKGRFRGNFEGLQKSLKSRRERAFKASFTRLKKRAKEELSEIRQVLQRMHILEAEWIQRVAMAAQRGGTEVASAKEVAANKGVGLAVDGASDPYELRFPFTGEVWLDELNNYRPTPQATCKVL